MIVEWLEAVNTHDLKAAGAFVTKDAQLHLKEHDKRLTLDMSWDCWCGVQAKIMESLPDYHFEYRKAVGHRGAVVLKVVRAGGTHSGTPFGYGPFAPLSPTGKFVENDPEEVYFFFREGEEKISKIMSFATGEFSGAPGLYAQLACQGMSRAA